MFDRLVLFLATLGSVAYGYVDITTLPMESSAQIIPGTYLIELDAGSFPTRRSLEGRSLHRRLYDHLDKRGITWRLREEFTSVEVFVGASITLKKEDDLYSVGEMQHVVGIYPVYIQDAPELPLLGSAVRPPPGAEDMITHNMTGINRLHKEGLRGDGVKIAVIDSGIDYNLDLFGKSFGKKGDKVYTGYDFVGDAYTGNTGASTEPKPDKDPLDTCYGHGTAVAGVLAANLDPTYKFVGVAPNAKIAAYRVFSCTGKSNDELIVKAMLKAYEDGNDILNLSLVTSTGWSSHVLAVVADRISKRGRIVATAAGNNGAFGPWYASSPGTGPNVISVGSVEAVSYKVATAALSNGRPPIPYFSATALPIPGSRQIYVPSDLDACVPLPQGVNVAQFVVLARRGNCAFAQKITNIKAAGGKYALFYNNVGGLEAVDLTGIIGALILKVDGEDLLQYNMSSTVTISFPTTVFQDVSNIPGGLIASTSSWGPSNDLFFKPNVVAPGGTVLIPLPSALGSWTISTGTSFSSPLVAGASALMIQAKGKSYQTATEAKSLFELTSTTIPTAKTANSPILSLAQQGAGLINAYDAVRSTTFVSPSILHLNDTVNSEYTQYITINNRSWKTKTCTLSHVPASTVLTVDPNNQLVLQTPTVVNNVAKVQLGSNQVTVWPLLLNVVKVTITPPTGLDPKTYPVFTGQIKISCTGDDDLVVSYLGVAGAMKERKVIDTSTTYFGFPIPAIVKNNAPITGTTTYTFQGTDYPVLFYRLASGSQVVKLDLVSANYTLPAQKRSSSESFDLDVFEKRTLASGVVGKRALQSLREHERRHRLSRLLAGYDSLGSSSDVQMRRHIDPLVSTDDFSTVDARSLSSAEPSSHISARGFLRDLFDWVFPDKKRPPQAPKGSNVDTVGAITEFGMQSRNVLSTLANNGYESVSLSSRKFANGTIIPNGSYRLLLRALRFTGDYEMWLSPVVIFAAP
ncbi:hypothetical protein FRC02_009917 [Tulasnella sp. 418]|nr:hypothetical protein FRC02_009917 [Tulasnella sp. 418]